MNKDLMLELIDEHLNNLESCLETERMQQWRMLRAAIAWTEVEYLEMGIDAARKHVQWEIKS